ncbi:MAG: hypothetical protein GQ583_11625 [Methyloprofundus sp.]|nr:hypothetical protein [Methyloprofundus sp.]
MFKFLPGIIFVQLLTGGLVLMAFNWSYDFQLIIVIVFIALISSILAAFWFASIARNIYIDDQATLLERHAQDRESILKESEREKAGVIEEKSQLKEQHARERERILLDAERDKANTIAESYQKIALESRKAHAKANFKVGAVFAAAVGAGGIMIFSQLVTVGVMVLVASGSGLSGYVLRARHERISRKKQLAINERKMLADQSEIPPEQK